ncbi:YdcF family protein [Paenibacillus larvae]|uniref:Vancomycin high temperature exclusion protein n=1 Tax=Paenibacillus larvae subsp. larvae TaxID=147375 RepID=A0A6C0QSC0_9BACL|nr:YdcF family protein [Paenibacillus larvae]QHZ51228.1 vancomycin high temperature exclusion protein [Paenibacillus larvae subsp. larvae]
MSKAIQFFLKNKKKRKVLGAVFLGILLAGLLWTFYVQWLLSRQDYPALPEGVDTGIVLGAKLETNQASPGLAERLDQAIRLYNQRKFKHLIVSGGLDKEGDSQITEAEGMRNYLVQKGIPEQAITMEKQAKNTYENLVFSKRIMEQKGWTSCIIITREYHGARAMDIADFIALSPAYLSTTDSTHLFMPYHKIREILAFTKWEFNKWRMRLNITVQLEKEGQHSIEGTGLFLLQDKDLEAFLFCMESVF